MPDSASIPVSLGGELPRPLEPGQAGVAALGDLMLAGEWSERARRGEADEALRGLRRLCGDYLLFGNLEVTLGGDGLIEKQPRIIGEPETLARCIESLGLEIACVANNHAFDGLWEGFEEVCRILEAGGVRHLGAGSDRARAGEPLILDRHGISLGWLAYADIGTHPSHVAAPDGFGVNPLEPATATEDVRRLKERVDHVLVSLHWGVEYSHLPRRQQVALARRLVDSGASLVLGHHAHVLQGVEVYGEGVIAYNLGNALATDLPIDGRLAIRQTRRSRSSAVLRAVLGKERVEGVEVVPFRLRGRELLTGDPYAARLLERANQRIGSDISPAGWRALRLYEDVVLRTLGKLHPRVIGSIRGHHFTTFFKNVSGALRGRGSERE